MKFQMVFVHVKFTARRNPPGISSSWLVSSHSAVPDASEADFVQNLQACADPGCLGLSTDKNWDIKYLPRPCGSDFRRVSVIVRPRASSCALLRKVLKRVH
jgi:hypothetical protein